MPFALHGCLFIIATRLIVSLLLKRRQKGFLSRRPIPNSSRMTSRSFPPETNPPSHVVQWDRGLIETYKISPHERSAVKSGPNFMAIITSKHGRCAMAMLGWIALGTFLVFGQGSTGTLSGIARDATGAVVPEVSIEARHIESGLTRRVETNDGGDFKMPFMPVGVGPSPSGRGRQKGRSGLQAAANLETLRLSTPRGRRLPLGLPPGSHRVTVDLLAAQVDFVDSP